MAKSRKTGGADTLDEIESSADRLVEWIYDHAAWVIGGVVLCIALGGIGSLVSSRLQTGEDEASMALTAARDGYRQAMGASPGGLEVPELANPEAAREIRAESAARFQEIASEHEGTVAGTLARLEAAGLLVAQGTPEEARAELERALEGTAAGSRLNAIVLQRLGLVQEQAGRWSQAAESYASAGTIESYPLRYWALADAARCFAEAGDDSRALALLERVETESPDFRLPDHHRTLLRELRSRRSG